MKKEENATAKTTVKTKVSTSSTGNTEVSTYSTKNCGYVDVVDFCMVEGRYPTAEEEKELGLRH